MGTFNDFWNIYIFIYVFILFIWMDKSVNKLYLEPTSKNSHEKYGKTDRKYAQMQTGKRKKVVSFTIFIFAYLSSIFFG